MNEFHDPTKSVFSGVPIEYVVPNTTQVIFVNDFFIKDISGGAELTTDAIIKKSPYKVFRMHSKSVTRKLLEKNKDKHWIFGNFTMMDESILHYLPTSNISYSIVEYDFKFCSYRSTNRHLLLTGQPCHCSKQNHGLLCTRFFQAAENIFWMSEAQKEFWLSCVPELLSHPGHLTLSSVFDDETLNMLKALREKNISKNEKWAILGSGSWIKGGPEAKEWCELTEENYEVIPNLPYQKFLEKLASYRGLIFFPLDKDTCPRLVIEAKLLGLELNLNDNVLHQHEDWAQEPIEQQDVYLRSRADLFWKTIAL